MDPNSVESVISASCEVWSPANDIEITLEANPTSVEAGKFTDFRQAGVNRVSLGVQALDDASLKALGRLHGANQALAALEIARNTFVRVSFDLIYARQDQTREAWEAELTRALSLEPDHLSLYQLTIEQGTAFGDRFNRGKLPGLPDEDLSVALYEATQTICANAGLSAYEVSNYAKPGAESRHNLIYWRYGDYAGIGPGAHGRLTTGGTRIATETALAPSAWLERVEKLGSGEVQKAVLSKEEQADEFALMGLRLTEGIDLERYYRISGRRISGKKIADLSALGMIKQQGNRLKATPQGRMVLNSVLAELLSDP